VDYSDQDRHNEACLAGRHVAECINFAFGQSTHIKKVSITSKSLNVQLWSLILNH